MTTKERHAVALRNITADSVRFDRLISDMNQTLFDKWLVHEVIYPSGAKGYHGCASLDSPVHYIGTKLLRPTHLVIPFHNCAMLIPLIETQKPFEANVSEIVVDVGASVRFAIVKKDAKGRVELTSHLISARTNRTAA